MRIMLGGALAGLALTASVVSAQTIDADRAPMSVSPTGQTKVNWKVLQEAPVAVQVVNAAGRPVRTLAAGRMAPGDYSATIDGKGLATGSYTLRVASTPGAAADYSFGVGGMLGALKKKVMYRGDRKVILDAKNPNPEEVTVKVDGEEWSRVDALGAPGNNYAIDGPSGVVELSSTGALEEGSEIAVTYPAGNVFENPWAIKAAPDGSLYIADARADVAKCRLYKVDATGKPVKEFGKNGILDLPVRDIQVDQDGQLYLLTGGHHVEVRDANGVPKYNVAGYINPYREGVHEYEGGYWNVSLGLNENKHIVIVTGNNSNVLYDASVPDFQGYIAIQNLKDGATNPPVYGKMWGPCVAMTDNTFYQTTCWNSLAKISYDPATKKFTNVWTTPARDDVVGPRGADNLYHGLAVELDGSGLIYIADAANHRIQIFFDAGDTWKYLASIGTEGTDIDRVQMMAPHGLSFSPDGKSLYVSEDGMFYPVNPKGYIKGLARVTRLTLGFKETIEAPLEVK